MVRNVRPGSIRERSSGGAAARDPFDALLARAARVGGIRTVPADYAGSSSAENVVEAGEPVKFRCPLPAGTGPVQVLLFERDASGVVTLLSHGVLLGGDVWYRDEVVVPREDVLIGRTGPSGRIRLTIPGTSTLLLVCCREHRVRFDKLPLFERTVLWQQPGPVPHGPVSREELDELYHLLTELPSESWMVLAATVVVRPSMQPAKLDLPQTQPAAKLPPKGENSGASTAAPRLREAPTMNDARSNFQIADDVRASLALQTDQLRTWADQTPEPLYRHEQRDAAVGRFGIRINTVSNRGLFLGGFNPSREDILEMQAQIAHCIHRLSYDEDKQRWAVAAGTPAGRRARGYIDLISQNNYKYPPPPNVIERPTIPKVDMALIAHCFRTPIEIWEAWDDDLFDFWITRIKQGSDLFRYEAVDYLLDFASYNNELELKHFDPSEMRAARVEWITLPTLPSDVRLGFAWDLPKDFLHAEVMLFEFDHAARQLSLISTHGNTGGDLLFETRLQIPRVAGGGTEFGPSRHSDLLMLLVRPTALAENYHDVSSLKKLGFFTASERRAFYVLTSGQIEKLRRMLFRLPLRDWRLFKKSVEIKPTVEIKPGG